MCKQERQQVTLLQHKLQRALKALIGSDATNHSLSADSTTAQNNWTLQDAGLTVQDTGGSGQKHGMATRTASQQKPRPSMDAHQDDHNNATMMHGSTAVQNRGGSGSTNRTASLQAALSPIRLLAHQLAQSGDTTSLRYRR